MTVREQHTQDRLAPPRPASLPHEVMALLPDQWPAELPLARVTTCGPSVSIAVLHQLTPTPVYGPPDPAVLAGGYASTAQLLLAVLASQPHGAANKDWLSEALITRRSVLANKDDPEERVPLQRVENPVSVLRHLLVPPVLRTLPTIAKLRLELVSFYRSTRESGCGYRLAGMPLIWVDVVAIEESIKRAHALEQFGSDAQREWEAAYALLMQGEFVEREPYSDWAVWRRQEQERQRWECVQALQGYYRKQGEPGEREATRLLQRYWQSHMSNEDAFRPLVELLGKQECFGQAEEAYTHLSQALEEEGKDLDRRTQEVMVWLRALQIQRTPSQQQSISLEKEPERLSTPLSKAVKDTSVQELGLDTRRQEHSKFFTFTQNVMEGVQVEQDIDASRRSLLQVASRVLGTAVVSPHILFHVESWERLSKAVNKPSIIDENALSDLETIIGSYWRLFYSTPSPNLIDAVFGFLQTITSLLEYSHPTIFYQRLCAIASKTTLLAGRIALDQQHSHAVDGYYTIAYQTAQKAGDATLQAVVLARMASVSMEHEPEKAISLCQQAQHLLTQGAYTATTHAWLATQEAEIWSMMHQEVPCLQALELAERDKDALVSGSDPYWTNFDRALLFGFKGVCYLKLHQSDIAYKMLKDAISLAHPSSNRQIAIFFSDLAATFVQREEPEEACSMLSNALDLVTSAKSTRVMQRLIRVRNDLEAWNQHSCVRLLDERLVTVQNNKL